MSTQYKLVSFYLLTYFLYCLYSEFASLSASSDYQDAKNSRDLLLVTINEEYYSENLLGLSQPKFSCQSRQIQTKAQVTKKHEFDLLE